MIDFFALYTLKGVTVKLLKETKSLKVTINGLNCDGKMSWKVVRSLRQIFNWTHRHLEVESIILDSKFNEFYGHDLEQFEEKESSDVLNYFKEYQELLVQMLKSPQYIILDMGKSYPNSLVDFALVCDFRIASSDAKMVSDIHENCLLPTHVLSTLGSHMYGQSFVRDLCINHSPSNNQSWLQQMVQENYSNEMDATVVLKKALNINLKLSAVSRIQTKALLYSQIENQLSFSFQSSLEYLNASLISGEFFTNITGLYERTNPRDVRPITMHEEKSSELRTV